MVPTDEHGGSSPCCEVTCTHFISFQTHIHAAAVVSCSRPQATGWSTLSLHISRLHRTRLPTLLASTLAGVCHTRPSHHRDLRRLPIASPKYTSNAPTRTGDGWDERPETTSHIQAHCEGVARDRTIHRAPFRCSYFWRHLRRRPTTNGASTSRTTTSRVLLRAIRYYSPCLICHKHTKTMHHHNNT